MWLQNESQIKQIELAERQIKAQIKKKKSDTYCCSEMAQEAFKEARLLLSTR